MQIEKHRVACGSEDTRKGKDSSSIVTRCCSSSGFYLLVTSLYFDKSYSSTASSFGSLETAAMREQQLIPQAVFTHS